MSVAFIDTETTGLDPELNPIWEIAVILPDGPNKGEHCWQVLLPPDLRIVTDDEPAPNEPYVSTWVLDNTGLGDRYDSTTAVTPAEAVERFCSLVDGRHLVGAVVSFDEERIRRMYRTHIDPLAVRYPWHYHLIDVEALAVGYLHAAEDSYHLDVGRADLSLPWNSDDISRAVNVGPPTTDRHTALGDARWAQKLYDRVVGTPWRTGGGG